MYSACVCVRVPACVRACVFLSVYMWQETQWLVVCVEVTSHPPFSREPDFLFHWRHRKGSLWLLKKHPNVSVHVCSCLCICVHLPAKSTSCWRLGECCQLCRFRPPGDRSEFLWGCTPCCTRRPPTPRRTQTKVVYTKAGMCLWSEWLCDWGNKDTPMNNHNPDCMELCRLL